MARVYAECFTMSFTAVKPVELQTFDTLDLVL